MKQSKWSAPADPNIGNLRFWHSASDVREMNLPPTVDEQKMSMVFVVVVGSCSFHKGCREEHCSLCPVSGRGVSTRNVGNKDDEITLHGVLHMRLAPAGVLLAPFGRDAGAPGGVLSSPHASHGWYLVDAAMTAFAPPVSSADHQRYTCDAAQKKSLCHSKDGR